MNKLIIGNKNYSTWSFRAWWVLRRAGVTFEEFVVPLYVDGYREQLLAYSPTGMVPVYQENDLVIWDSLAICEYIAEKHPALWPESIVARARARSVSAEMHAGFFAIRGALHMNCRALKRSVTITPEIELEIRRIEAIITDCRREYGQEGPWLFGRFSIADAMFAPIMFSFATYDITCNATVSAYRDNLREDALVRAWLDSARDEKEVIGICETGTR